MIELVAAVLLGAAPPLEPKPFDPRVDEAQRLRTRGLTDDSLKLLDAIEADAKKKKDSVSEGRAKQKRGDLLLDARDCDGAKAQYESAIKAFGKTDAIATAQTWNDLGMWAKRCATPEDQKVFFTNALKLYEGIKYQKGIRLLANNLGSANFVGGDKVTALGYFKKSAAAARALGDDEAWLTVQANVALMELLLSQEKVGRECTAFSATEKKDAGFQRALTAFNEAAQVAQRSGTTALSVCAKFGSTYSPLCEPCLINK
jgi:tetratricopeptide (TPR) repeat protein